MDHQIANTTDENNRRYDLLCLYPNFVLDHVDSRLNI
jgi:hypothetical protein